MFSPCIIFIALLSLAKGQSDCSVTPDRRRARNALVDKKWPKQNGKVIVPYVLDGLLGESAKAATAAAAAEFESKTCVRWVERKQAKEYIRIIHDKGCWSYIGNQHLAEQQLSLGTGCDTEAIAAHQMMHALGFEHEHNRPDRDHYVDVLLDNIRETNKLYFDKCTKCDTFGLPYDYESILHVGKTYFSKNGKDTVVPKDPKASIGQRIELSDLDVKKINKLYDCQSTDINGNNSGNNGNKSGKKSGNKSNSSSAHKSGNKSGSSSENKSGNNHKKSSCPDAALNCPALKFFCAHPKVRHYCRKTCNVC